MSAAWLAAGAEVADAGHVSPDMVLIPGGEFTPQYRPEKEKPAVQVERFWIDRVPVTQGEFLRFVLANPRWKRSMAPSVFRDEHYLFDWKGELALPVSPPPQSSPVKGEEARGFPSPLEGEGEDGGSNLQPVTYVSWFAARAYCASVGKRLPSTLEWEYAASTGWGDDTRGREEALRWYATPHEGPMPEVGSGIPNALGLHDLHRLWEWVEDFNSSLVTGDNRSDADSDRNLYCGAASADALNREDYAAFMRYAFRSSLRAAYSTHNLGFRCAQGGDVPGAFDRGQDGP